MDSIKAMWKNLNPNDQNLTFLVGCYTAGFMVVATWIVILVATFSGPDVQYMCNDKQAVFVERTIKDCMSRDDQFMSTCTERATEAYCTQVK